MFLSKAQGQGRALSGLVVICRAEIESEQQEATFAASRRSLLASQTCNATEALAKLQSIYGLTKLGLPALLL